MQDRAEKVAEANEALVTDVSMKEDGKKGAEPLSGEQINYAIELIEKRHQLRKTPYRIVWPFINYICCCLLRKRKPRFDFALKRSLRKRLALKISKSDQRLEEDPYLILGFGMNSYFDVMR